MATDYRTVFEAQTSLMMIGAPVVIGGLLMLLVGVAMLRVSRGTASPTLHRIASVLTRGRSIPRWLAIAVTAHGGFTVVVAVVVLGLAVHTLQGMIAASTVTEGIVEGLRASSENNRSEETFTVRGVRFFYSEDNWPYAFSHTRANGGPLRDGLRVRIAALVQSPAGSIGIVKLEIAERASK